MKIFILIFLLHTSVVYGQKKYDEKFISTFCEVHKQRTINILNDLSIETNNFVSPF